MSVTISLILGYLLGCINPSFIISNLKGIDIRDEGSGNAGASNALIVMGKPAGIFSALFDIFKAYFAFVLAEKLFPSNSIVGCVAGVSCILGHIFPVFMGFRGGKGLAALGGTVLAYNPKIFVILLLCEIVIVLMCGYICFVPITASVAFTVYYGFAERNLWMTVVLAAVSIIILLKHRTNLQRIRNGTEMHISYLWKKEEEEERVRENLHK